jgi:hypothetical protein
VAELAAERLRELAGDLALAEIAVVDAPLRVVVLGREVVVADVDLVDLLRCGRRSHAGRKGRATQRYTGVSRAEACRERKPP